MNSMKKRVWFHRDVCSPGFYLKPWQAWQIGCNIVIATKEVDVMRLYAWIAPFWQYTKGQVVLIRQARIVTDKRGSLQSDEGGSGRWCRATGMIMPGRLCQALQRHPEGMNLHFNITFTPPQVHNKQRYSELWKHCGQTVNVISVIPLNIIWRVAKKRKPAYRWPLAMPSGAICARKKSEAAMMDVHIICIDNKKSVHDVACVCDSWKNHTHMLYTQHTRHATSTFVTGPK